MKGPTDVPTSPHRGDMGQNLTPTNLMRTAMKHRKVQAIPSRLPSYQTPGHIHHPLVFNTTAFVQSFFQELLGIFPLNYFVALVYQRSHKLAWRELANRQTRPTFRSEDHKKPVTPWIIMFIIISLPYAPLVVKCLSLPGSETFGWVEVLTTMYGTLVVCASIACKYAYYPKDEYNAVLGKAKWTNDMTMRRMLLGGWSKPEKFKGLLENLYTEARREALVDIYHYDFHAITNSRNCQILIEQAKALDGFEEFEREKIDATMELGVGSPSDSRLPASALMMGLLKTAFSIESPGIQPFEALLSLLFSFMPAIIRGLHGLRAFGEGSWAELALSAYLLVYFFFAILSPREWGIVVVCDNLRRKRAYNILGRMLVEPGVPVQEFLKKVEPPEDKNNNKKKKRGEKKGGVIAPEERPAGGEFFNSADDGLRDPFKDANGFIYVDPTNRENVLTWTMCRNIVRVYGRSFMLRGEAYLSVDLIGSVLLLAGLNVLIVGGVEHYVWDIVCLLYLLFVYVRMVVECSLSVAELNDLVTEHREILRTAKVNMLGAEGPLDDRSLKFLDAIDELIQTREQESDPHKIFGFPANHGIIQTYLGLVGSGIFFAAQTFITSSATYDSTGKFVPGDISNS